MVAKRAVQALGPLRPPPQGPWTLEPNGAPPYTEGMRHLLLAVLATLAAQAVHATQLANLQGMAAGGPASQASGFTGEKMADGTVAVAAPDRAQTPPSVKRSESAVKPASVPVPSPPKSDKLTWQEKYVGTIAAVAGTFWITMGMMGLAAGAVTLGSALPIVAGALAIGFAVKIFTKKFRL